MFVCTCVRARVRVYVMYACMLAGTHVYGNGPDLCYLVWENSHAKRTFGRPTHRWKNNIKIECAGVDCIQLSTKPSVCVKKINECWYSMRSGGFLMCCATISSSRRTLLQEVVQVQSVPLRLHCKQHQISCVLRVHPTVCSVQRDCGVMLQGRHYGSASNIHAASLEAGLWH
jgi:hypothetical protein